MGSGKSWLALFLVLVLSFSISACRKPESEPVGGPVGPSGPDPSEPSEPPEPPVVLPLSPLTGKPMAEGGSPVVVTVDNNEGARLQSGLARADIVYEILAEGGITRFLALYHSQSPSVIGPIRSARTYFALLAKEWGAIFGHCGGDNAGLSLIRELGIPDANEFGRGDLFWRDSRRVPPHNLYSSVAKLRELLLSPLPDPEPRYEFQDWSEEPVFGIKIDYGRRYVVEYHKTEEGYTRHVTDGSSTYMQKDLDTDETILASNILVQWAASKVLDSEGRLAIDLIGEGQAVCLVGGRFIEGTWKKPSKDEPTLFYDGDGSLIKLTPGQTWIQIVPTSATATELPAPTT